MKALLCLTAVSLTAFAQAPVRPDARGCMDSKLLSRMPGCYISSCQKNDYGVDVMPRKKGDRTNTEGALEKIKYACPREKSALEIGRNVEAALKNAGYDVLYTDVYYGGARFWMTAQMGPQWVKLYAENGGYELTTILENQMQQAVEANAAGWARQINQTGRVSLYGINFDTGKAIIRPDSEAVLGELAKMLQANPSWAVVVAGHTDNVGARAMNMSLSRQRAESVIAWLGARGIDKARLLAAGFGDTRPLDDNATEDGRAKNRRVDIIKLY